jgi:hypothetical protein
MTGGSGVRMWAQRRRPTTISGRDNPTRQRPRYAKNAIFNFRHEKDIFFYRLC